MVSKTTEVDLEAAIAIIEECKQSHTLWAREIKKGTPNFVRGVGVGGGRTHHDRWVTNYLHVLGILRGL